MATDYVCTLKEICSQTVYFDETISEGVKHSSSFYLLLVNLQPVLRHKATKLLLK